MTAAAEIRLTDRLSCETGGYCFAGTKATLSSFISLVLLDDGSLAVIEFLSISMNLAR